MPSNTALFTLRATRTDDVDEAHVARTESIRHDAARAYTAEQLHAWVDAFDPEAFQTAVEDQVMISAIMHDDWVVAYAALDPETEELTAFYVGPSGQGIGVETALLDRMEKEARDRGLERIWVDALLNTTAFYAERGWNQVEEHQRTRHGVEIPVVKMERSLTD